MKDIYADSFDKMLHGKDGSWNDYEASGTEEDNSQARVSGRDPSGDGFQKADPKAGDHGPKSRQVADPEDPWGSEGSCCGSGGMGWS